MRRYCAVVSLTLSGLLALAAPAFAAPELTVQILSATTKDKVVDGAQVIFQKEGQTSITATTDAKGKASAANGFDVDDASVSMIVKKDGFSPLVVRCPCTGMSYAISETLGQQRLPAVPGGVHSGPNPPGT